MSNFTWPLKTSAGFSDAVWVTRVLAYLKNQVKDRGRRKYASIVYSEIAKSSGEQELQTDALMNERVCWKQECTTGVYNRSVQQECTTESSRITRNGERKFECGIEVMAESCNCWMKGKRRSGMMVAVIASFTHNFPGVVAETRLIGAACPTKKKVQLHAHSSHL
jgi:hypothetical protein